MANITIEIPESQSQGCSQRCTDAGGRWFSSGEKLTLSFPDNASVTDYYRRLIDDVLSDLPAPKSAKSALPAGREWQTRGDGGSLLLKSFTPTIHDLGAHQIRLTISTSAVDRAGDVVNPAGLDVKPFLANPVCQWSHDYGKPPIGRALSITKTNSGVDAVIEFTSEDLNPFGDSCYRMIKAGFLRGCSIGFMPIKFSYTDDPARPGGINFDQSELLEISICPVPANAGALAKSVDTTTDAEIIAMIDDALAELDERGSFTDYEINQLIAAALDVRVEG
jgi:HK97 family phage prohead protease